MLGPGDVVGEISLIQGQKTSANVTAREKVGTLFLDKEKFLEVTADNPNFSAWLKSMSPGTAQPNESDEPSGKEPVADEDLMVLLDLSHNCPSSTRRFQIGSFD